MYVLHGKSNDASQPRSTTAPPKGLLHASGREGDSAANAILSTERPEPSMPADEAEPRNEKSRRDRTPAGVRPRRLLFDGPTGRSRFALHLVVRRLRIFRGSLWRAPRSTVTVASIIRKTSDSG